MAKKKKTQAQAQKKDVVSFRCSEELTQKLDEHVSELRELHPGGNWTRSSAALNIVARELLGKECS